MGKATDLPPLMFLSRVFPLKTQKRSKASRTSAEPSLRNKARALSISEIVADQEPASPLIAPSLCRSASAMTVKNKLDVDLLLAFYWLVIPAGAKSVAGVQRTWPNITQKTLLRSRASAILAR